MNIEKVGVVYQTTDYGMFAGLVGNRDVMHSRVERIKKSIKENGWVYFDDEYRKAKRRR